MAKLPIVSWIGNAAAVLVGGWGAVSRQAQVAGCSRQTAYDHAEKVELAVHDAVGGGPFRDRRRPSGAVGRPPTIMRRKSRRRYAARPVADHLANNSSSNYVSRRSGSRRWKNGWLMRRSFPSKSSNGLRPRQRRWG